MASTVAVQPVGGRASGHEGDAERDDQATPELGGGLLGGLPCAIASLLTGGNPLGQLAQIVGILNQILGVLRGL